MNHFLRSALNKQYLKDTYGSETYNYIILGSPFTHFSRNDSLTQQTFYQRKRANNLNKKIFLLLDKSIAINQHNKIAPNLYTTLITMPNFDTYGHDGKDLKYFIKNIHKALRNARRKFTNITELISSIESSFSRNPYELNYHNHELNYSFNNYTKKQLSKLSWKLSNFLSEQIHQPVNCKIKHFENRSNDMKRSLTNFIYYIEKQDKLPIAKNWTDIDNYKNKPLNERKRLLNIIKKGTKGSRDLHINIRKNSTKYEKIKEYQRKQFVEYLINIILKNKEKKNCNNYSSKPTIQINIKSNQINKSGSNNVIALKRSSGIPP